MTKEQQRELDMLIPLIFQKDEVLGKIKEGESLKADESLNGWANFVRSHLPHHRELLNNPQEADNIYRMFQHRYEALLEEIENQEED